MKTKSIAPSSALRSSHGAHTGRELPGLAVMGVVGTMIPMGTGGTAIILLGRLLTVAGIHGKNNPHP